MKRMKFSSQKFLIGVGCLLFTVFGFLSFSSYSYRFGPRPQEWRVVGAQHALRTVIANCFSGNDADRTRFMICAQKKLIADMPKWGTKTFMQALTLQLDAQTTDRNFTQCHDLAHAIGWAGTMTSRRVQTTLPQCTNACVSGCQHGAVSAWYGMGNDLKSSITSLCIEGIDWKGNVEAQAGCFHEVGHAVADVASYDLIASLHLCDQIIPSGRIGCAAGVFMEMYEAATFASVPKPIPNNSPFWCGKLWAPYDAFCYAHVGAYVYSEKQDADASLAVCDAVPRVYKASCVSGISQNIFYVYQHKPDYLHEVEGFCRAAQSDMYLPCLSGLIRSSIFVEPDVKTALSLCKSLDASIQRNCAVLLGGVLEERRTKKEKLFICSKLESQYVQACDNAEKLTY